jgi:hypothetical protein
MRWIFVLTALIAVILLLAGMYRVQIARLTSRFVDLVWSIMTFSWRYEPLHDPMNGTDGEHNVGYVSRWALVEFGVECTRCGEPAAARMAFHRIRTVRLPDRSLAQVIDCPLCHTTLIASGVTEKGEHLLDSTDRRVAQHLATFARKKHPLSPMSPMEAHSERQRLKVKELVAVNPLNHIQYVEDQANADKNTQYDLASTDGRSDAEIQADKNDPAKADTDIITPINPDQEPTNG